MTVHYGCSLECDKEGSGRTGEMVDLREDPGLIPHIPHGYSQVFITQAPRDLTGTNYHRYRYK